MKEMTNFVGKFATRMTEKGLKMLENQPYWGNCMEETLGVKFHAMTDEETIQAEMMVNEHTCQPFGRINGGASLALAEMLAGHGSFYLCSDNERPVGVQISGSHVGWATVGEKVVATARIEHRGKTTHVWNVTINTESGRPVSIVRVTNMILKEQSGVK